MGGSNYKENKQFNMNNVHSKAICSRRLKRWLSSQECLLLLQRVFVFWHPHGSSQQSITTVTGESDALFWPTQVLGTTSYTEVHVGKTLMHI